MPDRNTPVAVEGDRSIEDERGAHRHLALHHGPVEGQYEGQHANGVRGYACKRAPLTNRFASATDVQGLQIAQPAVNGAQMVERGAASEVFALDECDREAALRAVIRDGQTVDAAADDEDVERLSGEPI